jgi:AcrR family transcriptional regulator
LEIGDAPSASAPPSERDRLVEAMAASCASRGYLETSVEELCAEAGVARAAFGRHFESKEECALAAVEAILAAGMAAVAGAYSPDSSEWESALQALRALLELFAARPALASLAFTDSRQAMPAKPLERYKSGFAILTAMLDRLREDSEGGGLAPSIGARAAIGGGEAVVRREIAAGRGDQLPRVLPDLVYGGTVPFLGQEEALRLARRGRELLAGTRWA